MYSKKNDGCGRSWNSSVRQSGGNSALVSPVVFRAGRSPWPTCVVHQVERWALGLGVFWALVGRALRGGEGCFGSLLNFLVCVLIFVLFLPNPYFSFPIQRKMFSGTALIFIYRIGSPILCSSEKKKKKRSIFLSTTLKTQKCLLLLCKSWQI